MRLAVMTDIHLEFLNAKKRKEFFESIHEASPDVVLVGGDIATATNLEAWLLKLHATVNVPLYFCLGNHDFYGASLFKVRELARKITRENDNICWLPATDRIELNNDVILVGHDTWGDARAGSIFDSGLELNDFIRIDDLKGLNKLERREKLNALGSESANHFLSVLAQGVEEYRKVIVVTHAPPFPQTCFYMGKPSDDGLPYFSCKAVGDVLFQTAKNNPSTEFLVLSGHTHEPANVQILGNLSARVLGADYGRPTFSILEL